jgi:putative ABC transport system substrate-binding protein
VTGLLLGVLCVAGPAGAQEDGRVFRVGVVSNVPPATRAGDVWAAFFQGLRDLGYVEGRNLVVVHRSSEGAFHRLPELTTELVRAKVDVIVAPANQNVIVAKQVTQTIPIVMAGSGDPVGAGLVASLARPGGNVTGVALVPSLELVGKRLGLLKELVPGLSRVGVIGNPANVASYRRVVDAMKTSGTSLGLQVRIVDLRGPDDLDRTFASLVAQRVGGLYIPADALLLLHRRRVVELIAKHRLPAVYEFREFVDDGGLATYGPSMRDAFRRAATYVDKILKGAKPADLPVEQAAKFELLVNMKTARVLGLAVPPSLLQRADEVLE